MTTVVSIKFRDNEKAYFFDPNGNEPALGEKVVVETVNGLELGECCRECHEVEDDQVVPPLRPVIRVATDADLRVAAANKEREREAFDICKQKIAAHGLDMKLVSVERSFDGNKILFFFTSDGRVDFRELVKDLASVFRTRIELRQIGVRDEAKMLGGLGICGRPFCCSQFLTDFQPVSTKMAKVQSMSLNPAKISGTCGRLMCCLRYEHEAYEDMIKHSPKTGAFVETESGYGTVSQVNLLRHQVKVRMDGSGEQVIKTYDTEDVAVVPGGRPAEGEPLPHVLQPRVKPVEEDSEESAPWHRPELFAESSVFSTPGDAPAEEKKKPSRNRRRSQGPQKSRPQDGQQAKKQPPEGQKPKPEGQKKQGEGKRQRPPQKNRPKPPQQQKPKPAESAQSPAAQSEGKQQQQQKHNSHNRRRRRYPKKPQSGAESTE